mgnify:CR=1 FL=1
MNWLGPVVGLVATLVGSFFAHRITKPSDADRASLLAQLAHDAAAAVVAIYPNKPWADLLQMVVQRISEGAGVPTKNAAAIEKAAAGALAAHGKLPGAAPQS